MNSMRTNSHFRHSTICMFFLVAFFPTEARAVQNIEIGQYYSFGQAPQSSVTYNVQIPAPGEMTVFIIGWVTTYNWGLDYDRVYVYNSEGVAVARNGFSSPEDPFLFHMIQGNTDMKFRVGQAGLYTIVVHSGQIWDWCTATTQSYTMSVAAVYAQDTNEPNETLSTATTIQLNSTVTAYPWRLVNTSEIWGDEDWYKIDVPSPGKLQIKLSHWIGVYNWGSDYDRLYVYNASGTSIGSQGGYDFYDWMMGGRTDKVPVVVQMDLSHAGTYYLRFHAGAGVSLDPYHFKTAFTPANDPFEPNDSIPDAKPILATDVWYQAYEWRTVGNTMNVNGDEDFYSFEAPSEGSYTIQLTGWIGIYNWSRDYDRIWILNSRGAVVGPDPMGRMLGTSPIAFSVPAAGKYYIQLHCGAASSLSGYQFKLKGNIVDELADRVSMEQFRVSPNPACDYVNVQLPETNGAGLIRIFAVDGTLLKSENVLGGSHQLDVSTLTSGMYLLEWRSNGRSVKQKLMVKK